MEETDALPLDFLPPEEGFNQPRRYRHPFRCLRCGHEYSRVSTKVTMAPVPCPKMKCRVAREVEAKLLADENMRQMLEEQKPPGQLFQSNNVVAIDKTAEIVMKDYGLTNLQDNIRHGEIAAPKLPPKQQAAADAFFTGSEVAKQAGGARLQSRVKSLGAQAIAGAFRSHAINPGAMQTRAGIIPGTPALRVVRKEQYRG